MTARSILAFGLNDSRLILRDSFLRMMAAMIVLIALGLRFGLPPLTGYLEGLGLLLIPSAAPTLIMMGAFGAIDPLLAALGYLGTAFWLVVLFVWSRRAFERHVVGKAG